VTTRASRRALALTAGSGPAPWYRVGPVMAVAAEEPDTATTTSADVYVYDVIGGWFGMTADDFVRDVASLDTDRIVLHLNTPGGAAFEAVAMANVLRAHRAEIVVHVDGLAASAGTILAMAGDEIVMGAGSQLMVHEAWNSAVGNAADLIKEAESLSKLNASIASLYAGRAGGTTDQWLSVMAAETWYTAEEAVQAGLATRLASADDNGSATGEQVVPGSTSYGGLWDFWDTYRSQDRFDLSVFAHAGRANAPAPAMPAGPRTPAASAPGTTTPTGRSTAVAFSDEQLTTMRQRLGVADTADEATIVAALEEALDEAADPAAASALRLPEGQVLIPAAALADLQASAATTQVLARQQHERDRNEVLNTYRDRFAPTNRAAWEAEYDRNPGGTRAYLDAAPVIVPTGSSGYNASEDDPTTEVRQTEAYQNWSS